MEAIDFLRKLVEDPDEWKPSIGGTGVIIDLRVNQLYLHRVEADVLRRLLAER